MADLVIRISGDIKNYEEALEKASKETSDLGDTLGDIAKKSAIAFAALTAEIGLSVAAFKESEQATNKLAQALQNQGIYSKALADEYQNQASELQALTGISDEAVLGAQTSIQAFIGQREITKELTGAIADLSVAKGIDLQSTAELIGKGINGHAGALRKLGIDIDENKTKQEQLDEVIQKITQRYGGLAAAQGAGLGSLNRLKESFNDLQEELGSKFAPIISDVANKLINVINLVKENDKLVGFVAAILGGGAALTGLVALLGAIGVGLLAASAAATAFGVSLAAALGPVTLIAAGVTALGAALGYFITKGDEAKAPVETLQDKIKDLRGEIEGLSSTINNGVQHGSFLGLSAKSDEEALADKRAKLDQYEKLLEERQQFEEKVRAAGVNTEQNAAQRAAADKALAEEKRKEDLLQASHKAHNQAIYLESQRASEDEVKLKQQQSELLKQLAEAQTAEERAAIQQRLEDNAALRSQYSQAERDQKRADFEQTLAENEEYQQMDDDQKEAFRVKNEAQFQQNYLNEKQARNQAAQERLDIQTKEHNTFLLNQQKFGTAYATINQIMHSTVVQGSAKAFGELAQLQTSSNSTLKGIGKAAATAMVIIKTAESAMNIYNGFSTIPIVGPALGIAGAAAAVAFGAEQVGKINAAADGGLLQGGIPGVDSIPVLAQQGELVVPRQNFDEVVDAVASRRSGTSSEGQPAAAISGPLQLVITLKDSLMDFIDIQSAERQQLGLTIKGTT